MEVKIKDGNGYVEAEWTIEDGVMVVSPISLEETFEPKDGDVLNANGFTLIFRNNRQSAEPSVNAYVVLKSNGLAYNYIVCYKTIRYATEEEKQKLFDKLAEEGWEWKADTKELVKLKWKPKLHEKYYYPTLVISNGNLLFEAKSEICKDEIFDNILIKNKWAFKTEEECQSFCDKLSQAISQVKQ